MNKVQQVTQRVQQVAQQIKGSPLAKQTDHIMVFATATLIACINIVWFAYAFFLGFNSFLAAFVAVVCDVVVAKLLVKAGFFNRN